MQYHRIPHSSLEVSVLKLGIITFSEQTRKPMPMHSWTIH